MIEMFRGIAIQAVAISSTVGDSTLTSAIAAQAATIATPIGEETILHAPIAGSVAGYEEGDGGGVVTPAKKRTLIIQTT